MNCSKTFNEERKRRMRVKLLENHILDAFEKVVTENAYARKITVSDIIKKAEINRNTFYRYFKNIDDISKCWFSKTLFEQKTEGNTQKEIAYNKHLCFYKKKRSLLICH